jgi:hypothetical protein
LITFVIYNKDYNSNFSGSTVFFGWCVTEEQSAQMGSAPAELDEAAWCAIAMGGAPVKMFYQECLERLRQATIG